MAQIIAFKSGLFFKAITILAGILLYGVYMLSTVHSSSLLKSSTESTTPSWKSIYLKNGLVSVRIVPGIGGRVMQYSLGDFGFFWINHDLEGKEPPESKLGLDNSWLNYGGDKLWPSPQGWDGDHQWPGPPDAVLDGGLYKATVTEKNSEPVSVSLISQEDSQSGIQFSRVIKIFDGTTRVSIDVTMKNIDNKLRRWGIWSHTQLEASNRRKAKGYNKNYWAYCPLNKNSVHKNGYNVIFGRFENPEFKPDYENGIMRVHYEREVGKIGVDSNGGWVATVDGTAGKVFVQLFKFEGDKKYPNQASVEFWINGHGQIKAYNRVITMSEDEESNPHVFESELVGPYTELKPGQTTVFHYDWYATTIGGNYPILNCSDVGVICEPFNAIWNKNKLVITGRFGVFLKGAAKLLFIGGEQSSIIITEEVGKVSPLHPLVLNLSPSPDICDHVKKATAVNLLIFDDQGRSIGEMAQVKIKR